MTIIEKVIDLLNDNESLSLKKMYRAMPEHTPPTIRGNIYRYINSAESRIARIDKGVYTLVEIVRASEREDGKVSANYTASFYAGHILVTQFHMDAVIEEKVSEGIYHHVESFSVSRAMEHGTDSLRGMLVNADARDVFSLLSSDYFDLLVTDPPYRVIGGGNKNANAPRGILKKNDGRIFRHNDIDFAEWVGEAYRVLKPGAQAYIFTNLFNLRALWDECERAGFRTHNLLVWEKNTARYMRNNDYILYLYKKGPGQPVSIKDCGSKTVHRFNNIVGDRIHETEKPLDLLRMYISNSCPENGWVIDPFAGSCSTLMASFIANVKCLAIELDSKYIQPAVSRVKGFLVTGGDVLCHY
jgi:site-specific DNA-methyltransferase (adenine-specific)